LRSYAANVAQGRAIALDATFARRARANVAPDATSAAADDVCGANPFFDAGR
jgi:hypothetical protein